MKINLRESLNELDVLSNNRYDLYNTYLSKNPSLDTKKKLSEAIYNNKSPKEILMILNEDWDDEESEWTEMDSKSVRDSDGFLTDYTWYWRANNGKDQHVFVFGDSDLYRPEDGYFDWECDSLEEAQDWFDGYTGPGDDEDDWMDESLKEEIDDDVKENISKVNRKEDITIHCTGTIEVYKNDFEYLDDPIIKVDEPHDYDEYEGKIYSKEYKGPAIISDEDVMDYFVTDAIYENISSSSGIYKFNVDLVIPVKWSGIRHQHRYEGNTYAYYDDIEIQSIDNIDYKILNFSITKVDNESLKEDASKEWKPNLNFKHIKDVLEKALSRGKYVNNEREEVKAALDLCDKKQKYTPEQRKFIKDSHEKMWRMNRKTESLKESDEIPKWKITYDKGRPGGEEEVVEFPTYKEAKQYAADHAKGWGFEVKKLEESLKEDTKERILHISKKEEPELRDRNSVWIQVKDENDIEKYFKTALRMAPDKIVIHDFDIDEIPKKLLTLSKSVEIPVSFDESLDEAMVKVEPSEKELNQVINVLNKYGFKVDDNYKPGRGLFGSYHIQVINPDLDYIDFDQLVKDVEPVGDALDNLSFDINMPITYNFGANDDNVITGGIDIHVGYKDDDIDEDLNESLNEDSSNTYKYTGKVFFDNLKDPDHYAVDRNDLYSNLFDFDIKNDTSLDSKIRKAIEKVDYDIFIDDENDHKYEDDNNDNDNDNYDDYDGSSGSISIEIITNRSLTKKEIDKLEKFYVETGNESYFTGILDDLVFTEYSNKEAIKKLEHDCYMIVANGVKKFEETFIKPLNLYGYSNASITGSIKDGKITGRYDFNYRYKNYNIYSGDYLIRIPVDEIYSNPEKYVDQIFNQLKDEWLKEIKEVDSKSADESLKEDSNLDDFIEPVDQVGNAKIYYDSNKRTYFTPSLDLDFDTLDQAKDFIGAPLYTDESLNETIVYPNGMPASDIDIHDALNFNFGLDRDMNDDNYTDEEKQRSLNYWINKMDEIDESLNEASYGGAYDIEDDMFFTKEELVEFAGDIAEEFSKLTGHSNCDVDNVYMENDPLALNVDIYDPKDDVSHSAYTRIDMRKIRKPSDIYKYMDRILKQLEDSYNEYHANDEEYYE